MGVWVPLGPHRVHICPPTSPRPQLRRDIIVWTLKFFLVLIFVISFFCIALTRQNMHTHTHTRLTAPFLGLPRWAGTRKVKPIWILLKQETVSGSGISWDICKSAPHSRQITTPAPQRWVFYRPDALPAAQPTASKHWRQMAKHAFIKIQQTTAGLALSQQSSSVNSLCICLK